MAKTDNTKTNAMRILEKEKIPYVSHKYECDEFTDGVSLADTLGLSHDIVYKTLVTVGKSKEYVVFVIPVAAELNMKKAAAAANEKSVEMLPVKDINAVTGYIRGGCTAIGMKKQYKTIVDKSAESLEKIVVSAGKLGAQLELKPSDYIKACKGVYADILA